MVNSLVRRGWIFFPGLALALVAPLYAQSTVTLSPATLAFGSQVQGTTSAAKTATLQNAKASALTITSIGVTGNFTQTGGTCPLSPATLAKGGSCTILITFTPATAGSLTGKLTVTDGATNSPQTASLTGTGTAPVTVSPTSLTFTKLPLGEVSPPMTVTLTNHQNTALTFNNISVSGDFALANSTCGSGIAALASCTVGVTFKPTATGTRSGTLSFADSALNTPQVVTLKGTGVAAVLQSIAVTPASSTLYAGSTLQYTATGTYSDNTTKNLSSSVSWNTSPSGIASISSAGLATGLTGGSTTVSAALSGVSGSAALTVIQVSVPTGSLNNARYYHSATLLNTGAVLVSGGIGPIPGGTGALGQLASAEIYSPGAGTFTFTGNLNTARDEHSATLLNSGKVLIAGGYGTTGELASAEAYTPATAAFAFTGNMNAARSLHTATLLPNAVVLMAGGSNGTAALASAELYNPVTGKFVVTGSLNAARFGATAALLPTGLVLIAGGADANGPLASAELYNSATGLFTPTGALNVARSGATATLLNTGQVLIADGYNYLTTGSLTSAELYDPTAGTFTLTGSLASSGWLGTATLLSNSTVLIAGSALNSAVSEIFNPSSGAFAGTSGMLTPRDLQTATMLPTGAVLLAGGHSNASNSVLAIAELYVPFTLAPPNLVSISVTLKSSSLSPGASQQLLATGTFSNNTTQQLVSVIWMSADPTVATVTDDDTNSGVVYGVASGSTIISACTGTICGTATVSVSGAATVTR